MIALSGFSGKVHNPTEIERKGLMAGKTSLPKPLKALEGVSVELGDLARDIVTGYEGIVIAVTNWLNQCRRITLQAQKLHDGNPVEANTFDVVQVVVLKKNVVEPSYHEMTPPPVQAVKAKTGGPRPEPTRAIAPR